MTWTFHNIVRHLAPDVFGFLDHDCIPIAPLDIAARIGERTIYGVKYDASQNCRYDPRPDEALRWFLWGGVCFFRFDAVKAMNLDFTPRMEWGLDTGGANWPMLYSRLATAKDAEFSSETKIEVHGSPFQLFDSNLFHIGGAGMYWGDDRARFRRILSDHLWETYLGGTSERIAALG